MNIFFLLQDTGRLYGAEQATLDLAARLKEEPGVSPKLLLIRETRVNRPANDLQLQLTERGIPFTELTAKHRFSPSLVRALRKILREGGPCILHCTGYKADVHGLPAARGVCPLVSTVHGWLNRPDLKERFYGRLDLQFLKRFDRVVALSRHYHSFLAQHGVSPERIAYIPSPLPPAPDGNKSPSATRNAPHETVVIGTLGRLSGEKNQALLIESARLLREQHPEAFAPMRLLIAGDGPERRALEALIQRHSLGGTITLGGFMPRGLFFQSIDQFVLCSKIENLPLCLLEAIAARKPIIATRVGGVPDLIQADSGLLVPPDQPQALADALFFALSRPDEMNRRAETALARCAPAFSPTAWFQAHMRMYRELL